MRITTRYKQLILKAFVASESPWCLWVFLAPADLGARGKSADTVFPEEPLYLVVCPMEALLDVRKARLRGWAPGGACRAGVARKGLAMVAEAPAEPSY